MGNAPLHGIDVGGACWHVEDMNHLQQWLGDQLEHLADTLRAKPVDRERLKAAIIGRRDRHRRLNEDWQHVDRDVVTRSS